MDTNRDNGVIHSRARRPSNWEYDDAWLGAGIILGYNPVDAGYPGILVTSCRKLIEGLHLHIRERARAELWNVSLG